MSPRLKINDQLILDVPDTTGHHVALDGATVIFVDTSGIDAEARKRDLIVESSLIAGQDSERVTRVTAGGRRTFQLSREGTAAQVLPGGRRVEVELHQPIVVKPEGQRGYVPNPYWRR